MNDQFDQVFGKDEPLSRSEQGQVGRQPGERPSEFRTMSRHVGEQSAGCGIALIGLIIVAVGAAMTIYGLAWGQRGASLLSVVFIFPGFVVMFFGGQKFQKAKHVAWTREAIERDRFERSRAPGSGRIRCPRCDAWID